MRDIHSHILFNIDDGAADMQEAVEMLHAAKQANVSDIIATPHIRDQHFDRNKAEYNFEQLRETAWSLGVTLTLGFEIDCNFVVQAGIQSVSEYCIQDTKTILLEFHTAALPPNEEKLIYALQREGLEVIIAHPERYAAVQQNLSHAERWIDMGCRMQLDASSLLHSIFDKRRKCAESMLKRNMAAYIASDAHCAEDYADYARVCKRKDIMALLGETR